MDRHLVAVKVGIEASASQRVQHNGVTLNEDRLEGLNTHSMESGSTVEKDRVLVTSDGRPTYLLPDIAYHRDKYDRDWETLIDLWGPDHHGYIARMSAALEALGVPPENAVYVGDFPERDVVGAKAAGMKAILKYHPLRELSPAIVPDASIRRVAELLNLLSY